MSGDKVFIDTNILVYAYDVSAGGKHESARNLVAGLWASGLGVVSTQVLQEFYVTATSKLPKPIDPDVARDIVQDLLQWEVVIVDGEMILAAMGLHRSQGLSFWDALIIAAAGKAGCDRLISEDLSSGRNIGGVKLQNPFA